MSNTGLSINDLLDSVSKREAGTKDITVHKDWIQSVNADGNVTIAVPEDQATEFSTGAGDGFTVAVQTLQAENERLSKALTESLESGNKLREEFTTKMTELEKKIDPVVSQAATAPKARTVLSFNERVAALGRGSEDMLPAHTIYFWGSRNRDRDSLNFSEDAFKRVLALESEEQRRMQEWFA